MNYDDLEFPDPVVITASDFFKGKKIGLFIKACDIHDNSFEVELLDPNAPIRRTCVHIDKGDTIEKILVP